MQKNKTQKQDLILWVYKEFFKRDLDIQKDAILIDNMITFFEVIEEIADKDRVLKNME